MKNISNPIFQFLTYLLFGISCSNVSDESITLYVGIDKTDTLRFIQKELLHDINILTNVDTTNSIGRSVGRSIHFFEISDIQSNSYFKVELSPSNSFANEFQRKNEIREFNKELKQSCNHYMGPTVRNHSQICARICHALEQLTNQEGTKKILLLYSDLMENGIYSFYGMKLSDYEASNPETITTKLNSICRLPNLKNITIYLVFQCKNFKEDIIYQQVASFWKSYFETAGAEVNIGRPN